MRRKNEVESGDSSGSYGCYFALGPWRSVGRGQNVDARLRFRVINSARRKTRACLREPLRKSMFFASRTATRRNEVAGEEGPCVSLRYSAVRNSCWRNKLRSSHPRAVLRCAHLNARSCAYTRDTRAGEGEIAREASTNGKKMLHFR